MITVDIQCHADRIEHKIKSSSRTRKVMVDHLNPGSFAEYIEDIVWSSTG